MSTPAAAAPASSSPAAAPAAAETPAAAGGAGAGAAPAAGGTPAAPSGAAATPPAGTEAGKPAEPAKPAAEPEPTAAERRLLAQVGRASKAEREAGQQVVEARAKIAEMEKTIAGHGSITERAKAADALESSLKDLKGAVKLLAKHGHKFEDVVKAWGGDENLTPDEIRAQAKKDAEDLLSAEMKKRDDAAAEERKARQTAEQRAAYEEGIKEAKAMLTADEKRWRLASNGDDADEVVDSVRASVAQHIAEKKAADKTYAATEEQVREMFAKGFDQAEKHLRAKAARYAERLAADDKAAADAKAAEAQTAVAEAAAVVPKAAGKGRVMGAPADPLGRNAVAADAAPTITTESRGSLPMKEPAKVPLTSGKREMGRPVTPLGR